MTVQEAYKQLMYGLYALYSDREAAIIADMVVEKVTGFRKIDRIMNKQVPLNREQEYLFNSYSGQLLQHKPVQYVLQEAWFCGLQFYVDERVLIPRPETAELAEWIIKDYRLEAPGTKKILDIGTGSGCIPIVLKKELPAAEVHALDISAGALEVAQLNAGNLGAEIELHLADILNPETTASLPVFDIIVSNPPYITRSEMQQMHANVLAFEPHTALFVPDDDALLFYAAIIAFAKNHLKKGGALYVEINESLGDAVRKLFEDADYQQVATMKDLQGKDRMVKVSLL